MHHTPSFLDRTLAGPIRQGRRMYRFTTFLTVFAMLFGGLLLLSAPGASANANSGGDVKYVWDGALNLRSGPSTSDDIITVMPDGAEVALNGEEANGFLSVTYNGMWGWAYAEFLAWSPGSGGGGDDWSEDAGNGDSGSGAVPVGDEVWNSAVVSDGPLNLRAGPSTSHDIYLVMPHGASLEIMGDVQEGFHPVRFEGTKGWAYAEFVSVGGTAPAPDDSEGDNGDAGDSGSVPVPGNGAIGTAMVIDGALNLRSGPATTYQILDVMPDSAQVSLLGDPQAGFYPVNYNGTDGWAFAEYLSTGTGTTPDPDPGTGEDPVTETPEPETPPTETPQEPETPDTGNGDSNGDGTWSRDELVAIIEVAAAEYGQPVDDMIRVAGCESVWDPYAVNSTSGASGLFQFMPGTWLTTPYADQDIFDPVANAHAAAWMWSVGRRNEWSCQ